MLLLNLILMVLVWRKGWGARALLPVIAEVVVSYAVGFFTPSVGNPQGLRMSALGWVIGITTICVQIAMYQNPRTAAAQDRAENTEPEARAALAGPADRSE